MIRLGVLVSGSGTTLQNLIDRIAAGTLDATIGVVVASRDGLASEARALRAGLRYEVVRRRESDSLDAFSDRLFGLLDDAGVDLVVCAGWLALLKIAPAYHGRVINVHPSLLPAFGGQGMYGQRVHAAVLAHGCKVTGCTVHFLDDAYDSGPIISQRTCEVRDDDNAASLASRVQEQERVAYPEAIEWIAQQRLIVEGRRVRRAPV